ncbi:non-heme iron oxygenase ferredoxin subunit [Alicyclobacillus curvatus]|jgi:nitrite reductase/ring-hydroxylating ferredoxin subunit|nr:non-heme iron oxygenase ferredoxin subunit [Alicyclobacillus curvatus]
MSWKTIGDISEIATGDMKRFTVDGEDITVYRLEDGWYATSDICTHQDCSLSEGDVEGNEIICWCHGGAFDIKTGFATRMPCVTALETFPVRILDGKIEIEFE